jgi:uncharacterized protein YdaU (DUF1376 family)
MAKDPAVLFYTSDFLSGTFTMDYQQRGKYITLLCLQHQKGKLTDKDLRTILEDTDVDIFEKFIKADDGFYYNMKLKTEAERRKNYSASRSKNRSKKTNDEDINNISKSYVKHMETVTGTETVTDTNNSNYNFNTSNTVDNTSIESLCERLKKDIQSVKI